MFSEMLHPAMKSACSCEIRLRKTGLNLFANTFIASLYIIEQRLMGRNWLKCSGLSFFRIRTSSVLFNSSSMELPLKIPFTHLQTSLPITSHWLWKKKRGIHHFLGFQGGHVKKGSLDFLIYHSSTKKINVMVLKLRAGIGRQILHR